MQCDSLLDCQLGLKHRSVLALTLCFFSLGLGLGAGGVYSVVELFSPMTRFFTFYTDIGSVDVCIIDGRS